MTEENGKMMVRGKALASIPKFVSKKFGKTGYQQWMDTISAEAHAVYALNIDHDEWYPLRETLIQPCANIAQLFFEWDLKKAAWDLGRFSADYGLNNVFKLFVKKNTVDIFINKASEYMSSYYKPAEIEVAEVSESNSIIRITKFPEMDKTIEYRIAGWIQRALEINGCKGVQVDIPASLTNMKLYTEFQINWH